MKAVDKLRVWWFKREHCLGGHHPLGAGTRCDLRWLLHLFGEDFEKELRSRGYDPTTIRFSVEPLAGNRKFASQRAAADADTTGVK